MKGIQDSRPDRQGPHSRRWRVTRLGRIAMAASIQLREIRFTVAYMKATS